jgi:uncharacterized protein (DUF1778 family)
MESRMGRPPKSGDKVMADRLEIRVSADEKQIYEDAAQAVGMDRSEWMRLTLNAAANRILHSKRRST